MYSKYRKEGTTFIPKFKEFLAAGGSTTPQNLAKKLGIDLTTKQFWQSGIDEVKRLFNELKALYD